MAQTQSWYTPKPKSFVLTPQYYKECVDQAVTYNSRLCIDRKHRMPFLDSQTGVAQNCCSLWQQARFRRRGTWPTQLYSYPAKRWRKKKRAFYNDYEVAKARDIETGENDGATKNGTTVVAKTGNEADLQTISAVENPAVAAGIDVPVASSEVSGEASKDAWYDELDPLEEVPDAGEIDYHNSDSSDYEETYVKRRKKKKRAGGPGRGRKSAAKNLDDADAADKPYSCDLCCARYKTRPGLTYHLNHNHNSATLTDDEEIVVPVAPPQPKILLPASSATDSQNGKSPRTTREPKNKGGPNNYCDFCLGDEEENKKTGTREELVSCADCGRSGHPSCLQFTANMIISVKKYPWQCIECKSCGLCGTSDNDDQLLFCDDCDRGYHMYCLTPPLSEPPEGSWSCHLCIAEFYGGKKPDSMV